MKVLFLTAYSNLVAASRIKVYQFLPLLEKKGIKYRIICFTPSFLYRIRLTSATKKTLLLVYYPLSYIIRLFKSFWAILIAPGFDIIFIQEPIIPFGLEKILRLVNKNIIFQFTDAVFLDKQEGGGLIERLELKILSDFWKRMVRIAKCCLVENEYNKTNSWLKAYKKIPPNLREMFVNAYQSYIWNECIKELLKKIVAKERLYYVKYNIGSLIFYKKLIDSEIKKIPLTFQTISPFMKFSSELEEEIINNILLKENIKLEDLDIEKATGNFFKTRKRQIILKPEEFKITELDLDEINDKGKKNIFKITVSFILPKGCYATIITKRIFGQ